MKTILSEKIVPVLVPLYYLILFSVYFFQINNIVSIIALIIIGTLGYVYSIKKIDKSKLLYFFALFILVNGLVCIPINGNFRFNELYKTILYIGITLLLLNHPLNLKFTKLFYYGIAGFFLLNMLRGISSSQILNSNLVSRNYISIITLTAIIIFYISCIDNNKKLPILPVIIHFIISIYGYGRAGIITSGILLFCIVMLEYGRKITEWIIKKENIKKISVIGGILLIVIIFVFQDVDFYNIFGQFYKKGFSNSERLVIWTAYMGEATKSFSNFIFGAPVKESAVLLNFDGNIHNSFLQMHATFGIVFFLLNTYLMIKSAFFFIQNRRYILLLLMMVLCLRASIDKMFFSSYGEILLYYFEFYPYFGKVPRLHT